MRIIKSFILVLMATGFLTACHNYEHHGHPHGCPPGQAKKGNCHHWN